MDKRDLHYANLLKALREKHQASESVLYLQLNLNSQKHYYDLENCKVRFTDEIIIRICKLFHVPLSYFIYGQDEMRGNQIFRYDEEINLLEKIPKVEHKLLLYKKIFIETKLENIDLKLQRLISNRLELLSKPCSHSINVII